jgi:hypothetical protein
MLGLPSRDEFQAIEGAQSTLRESSGAGNSPAAERLSECIEWLSQDCWCAGWYDGIEFDLWAAIATGQFQYGLRQIATIELRVLQWLSELCGGWITWADSSGPVFVDLQAWKAIYQRRSPHQP